MDADGPHESPKMQLPWAHFALPVVSNRAFTTTRGPCWSATCTRWEPHQLIRARRPDARECYTLLANIHMRFPRHLDENFSVAHRAAFPICVAAASVSHSLRYGTLAGGAVGWSERWHTTYRCRTTYIIESLRSLSMNVHSEHSDFLRGVKSELNSPAATAERPPTYTYDPPAGAERTTVVNDPQPVVIRDARPILPQLSLDEEGFALVRHKSATGDFYDDEEVKRVYYAEAV